MPRKKPTDKGMMGIGTLIIFIAVVVVAAVAAAVLIGSGGSLEQRSMTTMKGTEQEVTSGLSVYSIIGSDASVDGRIGRLEMLVRLRPGSDPINLNTTILTIDRHGTFESLSYSNAPSATSGAYGIFYLRRSGTPIDGYINIGDSVIVNVTLANTIGPDERVIMQIIPAQGGVRRVGFTTPNAMLDQRIFLFP